MKVTKLSEKLLLLEFPTKKEMTLSNFRISEFKEGKEGIKGKRFTADEFIDKYSDEKGNIDYFSYWEGFNYSKKDLVDFFDMFKGFEEFSQRELAIIYSSNSISEDGYIMCMLEGDKDTLRHETAHALFFLIPEYKEKVSNIISSIDPIELEYYKKDLRDMDYGDDCLIDECHAYLVAFDEEEFKECFPSVLISKIISQRDKLQDLFDCYNK